MDTLSAFAMGEANRGRPSMVFDWIKAATIIKERNAKSAAAGLQGDWEWTGGDILKDGNPIPKEETYTYLSSIWAVPEIEIDGEFIECYTMDSDWDADTYWPDEALEILNS